MKKILLASVLMLLLVPLSAFAGAGYEKGFYINNDDNTFRLGIGGKVQNKFYFEKVKQEPSTLTFSIRRASVSFNATIDELVNVNATFKHSQKTAANTTFQYVQVDGATMSVQALPELAITVGMTGLPLSLIDEMSSSWFLLDEAPVIIAEDDQLTALTPLRSEFGAPVGLGVNFAGSVWKWFYSASVVNGNESNYEINPDRKMSFGFRTGFNILDPVGGSMSDYGCSSTPQLTLNLGTIYQGKREDSNSLPGQVGPPVPTDIKYIWTSTLGAAFRWAGLAVTAEGYYGRTKITNPGTSAWARPTLTDIGYYAAAGYYVIPKKLEIALQAAQSIRQGPANDSYEFGGGLNWYIFGNNLKTQLTYRMQRFFAVYDTTDPLNVADYNRYTYPARTHYVTLMFQGLF